MATTMTATMTVSQDVQAALRQLGVPVQPFPAPRRVRTPLTLHFGASVGAVTLTLTEVK